MATAKKTAKKPTTKTKTTAKKPTTKKPAAKKPAAKKTTTKAAAKKAPAIKSTVSVKAPAKKNPCRVIIPIVIIVAILAIAATLIVGFCLKSKTASCSKTDEIMEGTNVTTTVDAKFENKKLSDVAISMKFDTEEKAQEYCKIMDLVASMGGEKINVNCEGDTMKFDDLSMLEGGEEAELAEKTKADFVSELESEGYTCKK